MKKILKNSLLCYIIGSISLLAAILFAPIWDLWEKCPWKDWGNRIIGLLIAGLIVCYLAFYLFKKIKNTTKRVILVLTIVEFSLLSLIALGCVFTQFKILNISDAGKIFALAIWIRGTVELFRAYYYRADSQEVYPIWYLAVSITMVTFGAYCFASPIITNELILWIFVIGLALSGIFLLLVGYTNNKKKITNK